MALQVLPCLSDEKQGKKNFLCFSLLMKAYHRSAETGPVLTSTICVKYAEATLDFV